MLGGIRALAEKFSSGRTSDLGEFEMKQAVRVVLICMLFVSLLAVGPGAAAQTSGDFTIEDPIIVESKDGTPIVATLMLPSGASRKSPAPVVLQTHGWGGTRAKSPSGLLTALLQRGYAVLTWDSRGFGESGERPTSERLASRSRMRALSSTTRHSDLRSSRTLRGIRDSVGSVGRMLRESSSTPPRSTSASTRSFPRSRGATS